MSTQNVNTELILNTVENRKPGNRLLMSRQCLLARRWRAPHVCTKQTIQVSYSFLTLFITLFMATRCGWQTHMYIHCTGTSSSGSDSSSCSGSCCSSGDRSQVGLRCFVSGEPGLHAIRARFRNQGRQVAVQPRGVPSQRGWGPQACWGCGPGMEGCTGVRTPTCTRYGSFNKAGPHQQGFSHTVQMSACWRQGYVCIAPKHFLAHTLPSLSLLQSCITRVA